MPARWRDDTIRCGVAHTVPRAATSNELPVPSSERANDRRIRSRIKDLEPWSRNPVWTANTDMRSFEDLELKIPGVRQVLRALARHDERYERGLVAKKRDMIPSRSDSDGPM